MKHFLATLAWWVVFAGVFALLTWVHGDPSPVPVSGGSARDHVELSVSARSIQVGPSRGREGEVMIGRRGPTLIETPHGYEVRDVDRVIVGFSKDDPMAVFNAERSLKEANDRWAAGEPVDPRQARLREWEEEQEFKRSMESQD